jgi:hypothetical protein
MADKAERLPELAPANELPSPLDVGPFIWRSADVGITATGFLIYSTGVAFRLVALTSAAVKAVVLWPPNC